MPLKLHKPGGNLKSANIGIYGPGGAGKTTLIGTMPGRGLLIDVPQIEGGDFVLKGKDNIDVVTVSEFKEINDIYWALARKDKAELPDVEEYKWVAVDSVTAMQELAKRQVINERDIPEAAHKVSPQDWGYTGQLVAELLYRFSMLPISKIWVAQQRNFRGDEEFDIPSQIGPAVLPSVLTALFPPTTMIARLSVVIDDDDSEVRILRVGQHPLYLTKCRAYPGRALPRVIREPDLGGILRYLFADGKRPKRFKEAGGIILD